MNSLEFWKYLQNNPTGVSLDVSSNNTSYAATIYATGKIYVEITTSSSGKAAKNTINTPLDFEIVNVHAYSDSTKEIDVQVLNDTDGITDTFVIQSAANDIQNAGTLDDTYSEFKKGENDLVVTVSSSASGGRAVIVIDVVFG